LSVNLITIQLQSKFIYQNAWFSVFASSQFHSFEWIEWTIYFRLNSTNLLMINYHLVGA
jgi:hypothetical protein